MRLRRLGNGAWRYGAAIALALVLGVASAAALADGPPIGQVTSVSGTASIARGGGRVPAKLGDPLFQSDVLETGSDGSIGLTFTDNSRFSIGAGSQLALQQFQFDTRTQRGSMTAALKQGTLAVTSGLITHNTPGAMHISTPTAILGVRGTTFGVEVSGNPPKEKFVVMPNADGKSGAISVGAIPPSGTAGR